MPVFTHLRRSALQPSPQCTATAPAVHCIRPCSALPLFPQTFATRVANVIIRPCKRYQQTKTTDTLRVSTTAPQMHCANCEKKIKSNIRFVKGVRRIETSVPKQTVTIVYDSKKSNYEDFVEAFRKIGFTIDRVNRKK